jgi:hypothetical protein
MGEAAVCETVAVSILLAIRAPTGLELTKSIPPISVLFSEPPR